MHNYNSYEKLFDIPKAIRMFNSKYIVFFEKQKSYTQNIFNSLTKIAALSVVRRINEIFDAPSYPVVYLYCTYLTLGPT